MAKAVNFFKWKGPYSWLRWNPVYWI